MRVKIDTDPLRSGHAIRGVGMYTKYLVSSLNALKVRDFKLVENNYELVHYPYFDLFFNTLHVDPKVKTVVTIHDVIPLFYPDHYKPGIKGRRNLKKQIKELKKVDAIITDSETSKKDIVRFLGVPKEKIFVIYLAADNKYKKIKSKKRLEDVRKKYNLSNKFILYVGDVNYNKNIPTLIKACAKTKIPLVIGGRQAANLEEIIDKSQVSKGMRDVLRFMLGQKHPEVVHLNEVANLIKKHKVITLGFLPDKDIASIYNLAHLYIQPSYYEGFGLPVVEALACKTPVIASKTNCLVEISQNQLAYFDPHSVDDLVNKIKNFKENKNSYKIASDYSWNNTAKETYRIYKKLLNA